MADLSDLISYLLMGAEQKKAIAAEDPYLGFQQGVAEPLSQAVLGASQSGKYGTAESVKAGLLTGLMSGLFGGLSSNYQTRAGDAYKSALFGAAMGKPEENSGVLSPNLFKAATDQGEVFRLKRALEAEQSAKSQKQEMEMALFNKAIDNPRQYQRNSPYLAQVLSGEPVTAPIATQVAAGEAAKPGTADRLDYFLDQAGGDESVAEARFLDEIKAEREGGIRAEDSVKKAETDAYNRITGLPSYRQFTDINSNFKTLRSLMDNEEAATAPAMITAFGRILDPGATVREGEYNTLNKNVQSLLDQIQGDWRQAFEGKTNLNPQARMALVKIASEKYNQFGTSYGLERKNLLDALTASGGSPNKIPTLGFSPYLPSGISPQELIRSLQAQGFDQEASKFILEAAGFKLKK